MKKLLFATLAYFPLFSCTAIKQLSEEEISSKINCENIDMTKMIFYPLTIDGREQQLLFDSGASMSAVTDSAAIDYKQKKFGALGTAMGADGKETDLKTFTAKIESELFELIKLINQHK